MKKYLVIGSIMAVALSGCGGSSSGNNSNPPTVSSVSPLNGATDVSRAAPVTATFNMNLLANSVSDSSFSLALNGPVAGAVSFDAASKTATFTPTDTLAVLSTYTATLSTGISNLAGDPLSAVFNWSFTTADGSLSSTVEQVHSDSTAYIYGPKITYSDDGSATAIWQTPNPARLWANHYTAGSGWGTAFMLQTDTSTNVSEYQLTGDDNGNALVSWSQGNDVWRCNYNHASDTWGTPQKINSVSNPLGGGSVALHNDGTAILIWPMSSDSGWEVYAIYYTPEDGWSSAEVIDNGDGQIYFPSVKFDGSGNAIAVWSQHDGTRHSIYANRFVPGTGWGTAGLVENLDTSAPDRISRPLLAVDDAGNAVVVWDLYDGTHVDLWANRYDVTDGWQTEEILEESDLDVRLPVLAMNHSGKAIVAWAKTDASFDFAGFSSRIYTPQAGWAADEPFNYTGMSYEGLSVDIDEQGNALFFWANDDNTNSTFWYNRYRSTSGWAGPTEISRYGNDYGDFTPQVAVKDDGEAMLIFSSISTDNKYIATRLFK